jgi:hypothetical protein
LTTRDTVATLTPASAATCFIVARRPLPEIVSSCAVKPNPSIDMGCEQTIGIVKKTFP